MPSLIQTVMNALPADAVSKVAGFMGESPAAAASGLSAAVPALLAGALRESSTSVGAGDLLGQVRRATATGNPLDHVGTILSDERVRANYLSEGQGLASSLLGGQSNAVVRAITTTANLGSGAVSTLLAFLAPLVLGALGRATGPTPTASGLITGLASERGSIVKALPAGLGSLFGFGAAAVGAARDNVTPLLRWLIAGVAVALLAFFGVRNCSPMRDTASSLVTLHLPGGTSIDVLPGSIGFGVARYLESSDPAPRTFVFDNLNFDTASNRLTPESGPTVGALVSILKAYPAVRTRIVGYTDNQGDPAANVQLSEARAATVKDELVAGGIAADRIAIEGRGEANPVADNATPEGRAKNRRTELEIVSK